MMQQVEKSSMSFILWHILPGDQLFLCQCYMTLRTYQLYVAVPLPHLCPLLIIPFLM